MGCWLQSPGCGSGAGQVGGPRAGCRRVLGRKGWCHGAAGVEGGRGCGTERCSVCSGREFPPMDWSMGCGCRHWRSAGVGLGSGQTFCEDEWRGMKGELGGCICFVLQGDGGLARMVALCLVVRLLRLRLGGGDDVCR